MSELLLAIGFAIGISAVCSLFEAVLYSAPPGKIEAMAGEGHKAGRIFKKLRTDVDRPIAAILTLNTIAHTAGAAFAGSAAAGVFGHHWLPHFSAVFTAAVLVLSEIIPKTVGVVHAGSMISFVAFPLRALVWVMAPLVWMSTAITRLIAPGRKESPITSAELGHLARLCFQEGEIAGYQRQAIETILSLKKKRVKDVMTPRTVVVSFSEHSSLGEVTQAYDKWEHSRYPVYDEEHEDIVGLVLVKEIFIALSQGRRNIRLSDLTHPAHFVVETARLDRMLMEFLDRREHLFVVLDEYGGLAGVITLEDILEELIGREIVDESDQVANKRELARKRRRQAAKEPNPS
ncbi:MAG: hemolysin family protein [Deltaproteobacteria bacterium]|nr:hemolysin family protein [Deltaproteobacteria bacterium]